jgi:hypothetical protein
MTEVVFGVREWLLRDEDQNFFRFGEKWNFEGRLKMSEWVIPRAPQETEYFH